jgi:hypothetical protein
MPGDALGAAHGAQVYAAPQAAALRHFSLPYSGNTQALAQADLMIAKGPQRRSRTPAMRPASSSARALT